MSWGDNPGEGGQPGCNPPSPSGFSPPVPRFPPSPSPSMQHPKLHIPMMLQKTQKDEIYFMKSWKLSSTFVPPREGRVVEKRAREKTVGRGENKQLAALAPLPKRLSLAHR